MKRCHKCGEPIISNYISIRDVCTSCGTDLHTCLNCTFYDRGSYNECSEPQSEWVGDKDRNNFCDYFRFKVARRTANSGGETDVAKARLEALFKK